MPANAGTRYERATRRTWYETWRIDRHAIILELVRCPFVYSCRLKQDDVESFILFIFASLDNCRENIITWLPDNSSLLKEKYLTCMKETTLECSLGIRKRISTLRKDSQHSFACAFTLTNFPSQVHACFSLDVLRHVSRVKNACESSYANSDETLARIEYFPLKAC